jgi:hypothetical protein
VKIIAGHAALASAEGRLNTLIVANTKTITNMKISLPLLFFLMLYLPLSGQSGIFKAKHSSWYPNPEVSVNQYLYFQVDTTDGMFSLSEKRASLSPDIHAQASSFRFDEPDLKIAVSHYKGVGGRSELKVVGIQRIGEAEVQNFAAKDVHIREGDTRKVDNVYLISDIAENHFEYGTAYRIVLKKDFYTDFDPEVPQKKMNKLWFAMPVAMAAGGWLLQNDMRNQGEQAYENYLEDWSNGEQEKETTKAFLEEANDRSRSADITSFSTAGAVLLSGAILWVVHSKKNKRIKLQKQLKKVAEDNAKLRTSIELNPEFSFSPKHPMNSMGLSMNLWF